MIYIGVLLNPEIVILSHKLPEHLQALPFPRLFESERTKKRYVSRHLYSSTITRLKCSDTISILRTALCHNIFGPNGRPCRKQAGGRKLDWANAGVSAGIQKAMRLMGLMRFRSTIVCKWREEVRPWEKELWLVKGEKKSSHGRKTCGRDRWISDKAPVDVILLFWEMCLIT